MATRFGRVVKENSRAVEFLPAMTSRRLASRGEIGRYSHESTGKQSRLAGNVYSYITVSPESGSVAIGEFLLSHGLGMSTQHFIRMVDGA